MTGRAEVRRLKQQLDATFARAAGLGDSIELRSDFARYLCVLVSGFLEQAVVELILEHARKRAGPSVQEYVESQMRRFINAKAQKLIELLGSFDLDWGKDMTAFFATEGTKEAVDSVVDLKNTIAHGRSVGVTIARVTAYYEQVQKVVLKIADLCDPPNA
jgi:hypothetical protein